MHAQLTRTAALVLLSISANGVMAEGPGKAVASMSAGAGALSEVQLAAASRVYTGSAACEFNQEVQVQALDQPGHFRLSYKGVHYTMTPEPTTTGAVRLEDRKAGVVWVQIPTKSMLLNHRVGQRMVDACTHSEQRVALQNAPAARTASLQ